MTRRELRIVGIVLLVLVALVAIGVGLLYAYRAQGPAARDISFAEAVGRVQRGDVSSVTISGSTATLETPRDGIERLRTLIPTGDETLARAVSERNRTDPAHPVTLRYASGGPEAPPFLPLAGAVALSLLPILILVALVIALAAQLSRRASADRYEQLTRIADLRDRGVLSQEEFEREKRLLLR